MKLSRVSWENKAQALPGGDLHGTHDDCVQAWLMIQERADVAFVWVTNPYGEVTHTTVPLCSPAEERCS